MKVLITRPQDRIEPFKSKLEDRGYTCIPCPLFDVVPVEFESFCVNDYDGIILTSFYAATYVPSCDKDIFVVGESLKQIFPQARYFSCITDLKSKLSQNSHYLYLRGAYVTDDLSDISHDSRVVYRTQEIEALDGEFDAVALFSKRTGEIFERLSGKVDDVEVFALSLEIANSLKKKYKKIHVASKPNLEGMLDLF